MKKFYDVAKKTNVFEFVEKIMNNENVMIIFSPTSIKKMNLCLSNHKCFIADTHSITKNVEKIDVFIKDKIFNMVLGIGGGTACDIAKYISNKKDTKCICIPTMLSTNVYSTDKVALLVNGDKTTLNAKLPDEIILDVNILKKSTQENLYGVADILSIATALYDWNLSISYNGEVLDKDVYVLALKLLNEVKFFILNNDLNDITSNIDRIFYYIGQAGHITNVYGTGRPESGSEHIFAKELEKTINIPHGIAVAIGIIIMSLYQQNLDLQIVDCIKKLSIFHDIEKYRITQEMLKDILLNLKPRSDRYSIINLFNNDENKIDSILNEFKNITEVKFYVDN